MLHFTTGHDAGEAKKADFPQGGAGGGLAGGLLLGGGWLLVKQRGSSRVIVHSSDLARTPVTCGPARSSVTIHVSCLRSSRWTL